MAYTPRVVPASHYPSYGSSSLRLPPSSAPMIAMTHMPTVQALPTGSVPHVVPPSATSTPRMQAAPRASTPSMPHGGLAGSGPTSLPHPPSIPTPAKLTEGLPDLNSIQVQKDAYLRALEDQERQALTQLDEQRATQIEALRVQGVAQKQAYALQVDQQVQHHDLALTQQHSEQMMKLNQQYSSQRGVLEQQASSLVMDFQQKRAHEDMLLQQYNLQREMHDSQRRFQEELQRIRPTEHGRSQLGHAMTNTVLPPTPGLSASPSQGMLLSNAPGSSHAMRSHASLASLPLSSGHCQMYAPPLEHGVYTPRSHSYVPAVAA